MNTRRRSFRTLAMVTLTVLVVISGWGSPGVVRSARPVAEKTPLRAYAPSEEIPLPLPRECGGVNPPGEPEPACCVYGYVYLDGAPVSGATVSIQGPGGVQTAVTALGEGSDEPYFAASLSDAPVSAAVGSTVNLSVNYAGRQRTVAYTVVAHGQQVDLVLPNALSDTPIYYVSGSSATGAREIWRMNGDGSNRTYVRDGYDPDICPLNGRVLYVYNNDIHVMDIDGNYIANLSSGGYSDFNPDWSPDCSQIVYTSDIGDYRYRLYRMNADGSGKTLLPSPPTSVDQWYPDWSPDEQWIAFTSSDGSGQDIYRMHPDGSGIVRLGHDIGWYPAWSPDGTRIAYLDNSNSTGYGEDVWIMNADGSGRYRVTDEFQPWWPAWISNHRLMYVRPNAGADSKLNIFVISDDGTGLTNLTHDGVSYYRSPTVRPTAAPIATIHSITPSPALHERDVVTFRGSGQDADENGGAIVAYRWESNLDGVLSGQAEFTTSAAVLSAGTHTITFAVQDDEGEWSAAAWRTLAVTDQPFDMDVLILTNRERLAALYGESEAALVMEKLAELAAASNGIVLQVEQDPAVAAVYADWLVHPTSFVHANRVTDAIHDLIVGQLGLSPDIAYIVIAGDDRVVPFRRVRDQTTYPEHYYTAVPATTTTGAALAADRILTDDFYGDRVPTIPHTPGWGNQPLYIPDMAVGRLVETPAEIIGQIDQFLTGGEIIVDETIVAGYDFMTDSAQEICSALVADGLFPDCSLIGNSWTAAQFINYVLNQRHELVSANGHTDHYTICTPTGQNVNSDQVLTSTGDHAGTLIWMPGCHGGLNVPPETSVALDLVQASVGRRALLVGNTGYGLGYMFGIGLSERVMLNYSRQLLAGGETTAGLALVAAKQQYYLEELAFDHTDEKVLIEVAFYGIPMTRVISPDVEAAVAAATAAERRVARTEQLAGVTIEHVHYDFPALIAETHEEGTFYTCAGEMERGDGVPIEPRYTDRLDPAAAEAHGVVLRGALGVQITDFDPLVDLVIWDGASGGGEPPLTFTAWYPAAPLSLNRVGGQSMLAFGLGQFHGLDATQWLYGAMDVDIYSSIAEDWEPPRLWAVDSGLAGSVVTLTVRASDVSGIQAVVIAYADGAGNWSSAELAAAGEEWTGSFSGDETSEFFVQVVDGAGNVSLFTRDGEYMRPGDSYRLYMVSLPLVMR